MAAFQKYLLTLTVIPFVLIFSFAYGYSQEHPHPSLEKILSDKKSPQRPKEKIRKTISACQALNQSHCINKTECIWIIPKKKIDKLGRARQPYCRKSPRYSTSN